MSKSVAVTEETGITEAEQASLMAEFGEDNVSASDVVIPKILVMQGLSEMVTEGKAKFGDFVNTLTNEVVGNINDDKGIELIPFHMYKVWLIEKWNGKKYEFNSMENVTPANENKSWEEEIGGEKFKNTKCMNFYCLNPKDMALPIIVGFKSTSLKAGKKLATMMYMTNRADGKVPCGYAIELNGTKVTKEGNTFAVLDTKKGRLTTMPEIQECIKWLKTVKAGDTKVDDSDVSEKSTPTF